MRIKKLYLGCICFLLMFWMVPMHAIAAQPIELKAVSFLPPMSGRSKLFVKLLDKINERAGGEIVIKYLGGPEVIGSFEQTMAARNGVVDIVNTVTGFYSGLFPGGDIIMLSEISVEEERKRGVIEILDKEHNKLGLKFFGRASAAEQLPTIVIWTNKKVDRPQDLKGLRATGGVFANPILKNLGISVLDMPLGDMYTALERNIINAYANPLVTTVAFHWYEKIKYMIDHPLFVTNQVVIMNLKKWSSLPKHLQKLMEDVIIEMEPVIAAEFTKLNEGYRKTVLESGVQPIKFSPADAKWFEELAYRVKWEDITKANPELTAKLKPLLKK